MSPPAPPYPTPEDAETAFYEAIEAGHLDDVMHIWADDDEITCTLPGGRRLVGHDAIRAGWQELFSRGRRLLIRISRAVHWAGPMLAVHSVVETLQVDGETVDTPIAATNVFVRNGAGWRLLVHHASPLQAGEPDAPERTTHTLH